MGDDGMIEISETLNRVARTDVDNDIDCDGGYVNDEDDTVDID